MRSRSAVAIRESTLADRGSHITAVVVARKPTLLACAPPARYRRVTLNAPPSLTAAEWRRVELDAAARPRQRGRLGRLSQTPPAGRGGGAPVSSGRRRARTGGASSHDSNFDDVEYC